MDMDSSSVKVITNNSIGRSMIEAVQMIYGDCPNIACIGLKISCISDYDRMCGKLVETGNCADWAFFAKNGGDGKKGCFNNMFTNTVMTDEDLQYTFDVADEAFKIVTKKYPEILI